jgi:hypothetical protein
MMVQTRVTLGLLLACSLATVPLNAAALTSTKIDAPGATGPFGTQAYGINDAG